MASFLTLAQGGYLLQADGSSRIELAASSLATPTEYLEARGLTNAVIEAKGLTNAVIEPRGLTNAKINARGEL